MEYGALFVSNYYVYQQTFGSGVHQTHQAACSNPGSQNLSTHARLCQSLHAHAQPITWRARSRK